MDETVRLPLNQDDHLLDHWYHTIDLGNGLVSRGHFDHRTVVDRYGIPGSLAGKRVLDVATGDGYFAFEMERRGAGQVVAIDVGTLGECDWLPRMRSRMPADAMESARWGDHFKIAHEMLGSRVERIEMSVYDLSPERLGEFDFVFCGDLLLHLQNPLKALINIRSVTKETAVIETVVDLELESRYPDRPYMRFGSPVPEDHPGEQNTFWLFNTCALQNMLRYAGFDQTAPQEIFKLPPYNLPATSVVAMTGEAEATSG